MIMIPTHTRLCRRAPLSFLSRLWNTLYPDRRSEWEKKTEREFIEAIGKIKSLSVTDRGGASFDLEEIREKVIASRGQLKQFVHRRTTAQRSCVRPSSNAVNGQGHGGLNATADQ
jgi:hypothetical protein